MNTIAGNLQLVRDRIATACAASGREMSEVALLAVSKTFGNEVVVQAVAAGQHAFGENYIQEGVDKIVALRALLASAALEWHCIGPVQSNKTRQVAEHFDWVHSVDRLKIAQRLSDQRAPTAPPLQVCLQVNVDGGPTKAGVGPSELLALAQAVAQLPRLRLRGLMCIPDAVEGFAAQCEVFSRARGCWSDLRAQGFALDTLSMGMTEDLEAAIASGSTLVRVGRAVFGERSPKAVATP